MQLTYRGTNYVATNIASASTPGESLGSYRGTAFTVTHHAAPVTHNHNLKYRGSHYNPVTNYGTHTELSIAY